MENSETLNYYYVAYGYIELILFHFIIMSIISPQHNVWGIHYCRAFCFAEINYYYHLFIFFI